MTSLQLLEAYIHRIQEVNSDINALVQDNFQKARARAQEIDSYLESLNTASEEYANVLILHLALTLWA